MRLVAPLLGLALVSAPSRRAHGDDAGPDVMTVTASCERSPGPGRVRCDVEIRTAAPRVLRWADVQIVETPAFLSPLKGRLGPADAAVREPELFRFPLGLVARERGAGEVRLRVHAVVCTGLSCAPVEREARARVAIGPE